jgi:hypothetical protein
MWKQPITVGDFRATVFFEIGGALVIAGEMTAFTLTRGRSSRLLARFLVLL